MRVRITKMPLDKAAYGKQVDGSLSLQPGAFGGADYTASDKTFYKGVKDTISAVPREEANLEAEGGETAFGPISGQSIPDHLKIRGKRHHEGGVPLNLPDDTFIFSDTASLKINDPSVLAMFNKTPKKGGYTPAEIAKPYNINKYKAILLDPDTSKLERNTATIMIKNYIMKLGALAIVQESMKGFPQGIPAMAKPYMEANGISEEDLMPELKEQATALAQSVEQGASPQMPQEQNPMAAQEMQQMNPEQAMQDQQMMMNQGQGQPAYPQQMPSGAPVAMPQGDMSQMAPEGMMQYGGMNSLRRANQGMEQQQGGQDQQMMQIMQQVAQALQQGAQPEELTVELLQGQVPPEAIAQIFVELGMPEDQVQQLVMGVMQQMQGGQEQDPRQQQMSEEEMMAMQQQDPRQMQQAPMAAYGMSMGGYDMPFYDDPNQMAYGGVPKFAGPENSQVNTDPGGPDDPIVKKTTDPITDSKRLGTEYGTGKYKPGQRQSGQTYYDVDKQPTIKGRGWTEGTDVEWNYTGGGGGNWNPTRQEAIDQYCKNMGNPKSKLFYGVDHVKIAEANFGYLKNSKKPEDQAEYLAIVEKLKNCKAGGKQTKFEFIEEKDGEPPCICLKTDGTPWTDANGNTKEAPKDPTTGECISNDPTCSEPEELLCRCVDPNTGEVKEFPIEKIEECVCQDGSKGQISKGQISRGDRPHWSVPATTNVLRNALMQVNPASSNVVLPGRAQIQGAYEEYQTKVDQGLAANQSLQNAIMTGMAGSTGAKQSQMKDLLGKSLRASMDAVAGVQSRNVDRQRETNTQSAAIDNSNMLARSQFLGQALESQKNRKDVRTSNVNKRTFNTMGAAMDADAAMRAIQNANVTTPQYAAEYDYGFISPTGVEKPLTGANGATMEDRIQYYLAKTGDYQKAFDMAYKEARLNKTKNGGELTFKKGGYYLGESAYPFI
jgi:hypothetical protein